jgi:hypothetical protein
MSDHATCGELTLMHGTCPKKHIAAKSVVVGIVSSDNHVPAPEYQSTATSLPSPAKDPTPSQLRDDQPRFRWGSRVVVVRAAAVRVVQAIGLYNHR